MRATTVCRLMTMAEAATSGSTARWGLAAWPPTPTIFTNTRSPAAMKAPLRSMKRPWGMPGWLCMA
ncbi:hypothetical protein D3C78_1716930 [compost metagenome]